jgi:hypothetical protein
VVRTFAAVSNANFMTLILTMTAGKYWQNGL